MNKQRRTEHKQLAALVLVALAATAGWATALATTTDDERLTAWDGARWEDFGQAVAMTDDQLFVGAPRHTHADFTGAVYVYDYEVGTGWVPGEKIVPAERGGHFGEALAVDGDDLVVGAPAAAGFPGSDVGAVHVYRRGADGDWDPYAHTTGLDRATGFGRTVAIDWPRVVVGLPWGLYYDGQRGAAYAYRAEDNELQGPIEWLESADRQSGNQFGWAVAMRGDTLVVGERLHNGAEPGSGRVHAYRLTPAGGWQITSTLSGSDYYGGFGQSVAFDGTTLAVGEAGGDHNGRVHLYTRDAPGRFAFVATVAPAEEGTFFGHSVAVRGDALLVGAPGHNGDVDNGGSAYLYRLVGGAWVLDKHLVPSDTEAGDSFGWPIALNGEHAVLGAPWSRGTQYQSGSVAAFYKVVGLAPAPEVPDLPPAVCDLAPDIVC